MKNVSALALIAVVVIGLSGCNLTSRFGCLRSLRGTADCCSPCQDTCGGCESCDSGGCSSCGIGGGTFIEGAPIMQGETYTVPSPVTLPAPATYVPSNGGTSN